MQPSQPSSNPLHFFQEQIELANSAIRRLKQQNLRISLARMSAFFLGSALWVVWAYQEFESGSYALAGTLLMAIFIWLILVHNRKQEQLSRYNMLLRLNEQECRRQKGDFSGLDAGVEFQNPKHPFSQDLDLFTQQGLFPLLNRTSTREGRTHLADQLRSETIKIDQSRQEAISELAQNPKAAQTFQTLGSSQNISDIDHEALLAWQNQTFAPLASWVSLSSWILPLGFFAVLAGWAMGWVPGALVLTWYLAQLGLLGMHQKLFNQMIAQQSRLSKSLGLYRSLIRWTLYQSWKSPLLLSIQKRLREQDRVVENLNLLESLFAYLELRLNLLWIMSVDAILLLDLHLYQRIVRWHTEQHTTMASWREQVGEVDVLQSLGMFAFANPSFQYPTLSDQPFSYQAIHLGHPMIAPADRVGNDFEMRSAQIHLVTGANMSGKSTFMRTLGVNAVLAGLGAPVCALDMRISSFRLFTSMRIGDDLGAHVSSFYAELLRLKQLMEIIKQQDQPVFILLDEVLRGTNSQDRHLGVKGILKKLVQKPVFGLLTTHDLALGELERESQNRIINYSFNTSLDQDKLVFNYQYTRGLCHSFSASKLMESLELVDAPDDQQAR